jgi:hypothetical protein
MNDITQTEARLALDAVHQRKHEVLAEIDVPWWYWPGMAVGWAGLGALSDFGPAWATTVATIAFGAAHSMIAPRVLSGRRGSTRVSVRDDLVGRRIPVVILTFLVLMVILTIAVALLFNADGARHPATLAGCVIAVVILGAGPQLMSRIRARIQSRIDS